MALKSEIVTARQLYLFGAGDGKRVIGVQALCEATGLHEQTIWKYIKGWQKEAEDLLVASSGNALGLALSAKQLEQHTKDMDALRDQLDQVKWELKTIEKITAKLEGWMDKFSGDEGEQDKALRILEAWQRNCGQKSSLRSQFLALQKQWTSLSGVVDLKDIQVVKEKAMATGRARLALKKEETETEPKAANPATGIFARE
jgi:septal ring factor EnvC (AmiA/AmiB activator)